MSSRSKKTPATPAKSVLSTPSMGTPSRSSRPPSPTVISRVQEKNELASLNDRLASYIDRVRQLESENSRLTRVVQTQEDTVTREVSGIKGLYEGELSNARKLLDDLAKEKAKLQFENAKVKGELEQANDKLRSKEKDLSMAESRLMAAESQVNELQARLNDAINQRRHWEDEYDKLKKELDAMLKNLGTTKKHLEEETIKRVDLENRMQSIKEELSFKAQVHEQQLNETMSRSRIVVEEVDGRLQAEYESRLRDALQEMRDENERQIRQLRDETEATYSRKMAELQDLANRHVGSSDKLEAELRNARKHVEELNAEVLRLNSQGSTYETRLRDLENRLKHEQGEHAVSVDRLNAEIRRLRGQMEDQLHEYRDLMDVKIQLDAEIAAYRKLLESEETRLSLTVAGGEGGTPGRTPATEPLRKRKRTDMTDSLTSGGMYGQMIRQQIAASSSDYAVSSKAKDVVEVQEIDVGGKFVRLTNSSTDKDVSLGSWILKVVADDSDEISYKFHRNIQLKAGQTVTVWSSDVEQTHSAPSNLVMKDQSWPTGDSIKASLVDPKGEEMATQELKRSMLRTSSLFVGAGDDASEGEGMSSSQSRKTWGWSLFGNFLM